MQHRSILTPRRPALLLAAQAGLCALLVAGCGGGGMDSGGTGAAPASFAAGPITGFGSIIVNGVHFDDSTARVSDDDGTPSTKDQLKLGMTAEVRGGAISDDGTGPRASATDIVYGAALVGPVSSVDGVARSLVILGQTVLVLDTTVFDERLVGGFTAISVGALLEVHGRLDPVTGIYTATRVGQTAALAGYKIRGIVANLDTTAKTFTMGPATISYAGVTGVPTDLANGILLAVRLQTAQVGGLWIATRLGQGAPPVANNDAARVKGSITSFTSVTQFSVDGLPVDASKAEFPNGTAGIVLGAQVEVRGTANNGVIIATRVGLETQEDVRATGFELRGAVTAIDTVAQTFVVRTVTVAYGDPAVVFKDGTAANLAVGVQLEVHGTLSADGTQVLATRIEFVR
ncbi:MAG: DUF5666 domain-containing protein [Caldimonas sp.]